MGEYPERHQARDEKDRRVDASSNPRKMAPYQRRLCNYVPPESGWWNGSNDSQKHLINKR